MEKDLFVNLLNLMKEITYLTQNTLTYIWISHKYDKYYQKLIEIL